MRSALYPAQELKRRTLVWAAAGLVIASIAVWAWVWNRGTGLPAVPDASDVWYRRGSEALREGGYHTARKAFEQAVPEAGDLVPGHRHPPQRKRRTTAHPPARGR